MMTINNHKRRDRHRTLLTGIVNRFNYNHLVHPDRGIINPLCVGESSPKSRRMVGGALAYVQGASPKANATLHIKYYDSPTAYAGTRCQSVI